MEAIAREGQIARAALTLTAAHGLDAVTFGRVAAEAGVSKGAVQHHFPSRADLLRAAAELLLRHADTRLHSTFAASTNPQERLVALLAAALPRTTEELDLAFAATSLLGVTRQDVALRAQYAAGLARVRAAVEAEVSDLVPPADVEVVAAAMLGIAGSLREQVMLGVVGPRVAHRRLVAQVGALVARR